MFKKSGATRLGDILVSKGLISSEQLKHAIREQTSRRRILDPNDATSQQATSLGEILIEFGYIDRLQLKRGLNWQLVLRKMTMAMALCAPLMSLSTGAAAAVPKTVSSVPATVQAEDYITMLGVMHEATTDVGGGRNAGSINNGDWMNYTNTAVNIPTTGTYIISYRVASLRGGGIFTLNDVGSTTTSVDTVSVPKTDGWQNWITIQRTVSLTAGMHYFGIAAITGGFNVNWFKIEASLPAASSASSVVSSASSVSSAPASSSKSSVAPVSSSKSSVASSAAPVSSSSKSAVASSAPSSAASSSTPAVAFQPVTIQAENYSNMSGVFNEPTADVGGGQDTGNINTGDWMAYTNTNVTIPTTGTYKITYRVASLSGGGSLNLTEAATGAVLDTASVPSTGDWQNWVDVVRTVTLTAGVHNFGIVAATGGFNVNWFRIESAGGTSSSSSSAASVTPISVKLEAEDYSSMSGVYNEPTTDVGGGEDTGNINTGDWMLYTNLSVNIPATATYNVTYRVASLAGGGSLNLFEAGVGTVFDTAPVPNTGGWQNWVDVKRTVTLTKGLHNFGIIAVTGGFNVNWFKIESVGFVSSSSSSSKATSTSSSSSSAPSVTSSSLSSSSKSSVASSSSSSVAGVVTTTVAGPVGMNWIAPTHRQDGAVLDISEIGGYEIRYRLASNANFTYISINDAWTTQYNFSWLEGTYVFQVAAFDKNGVYSDFVNVLKN